MTETKLNIHDVLEEAANILEEGYQDSTGAALLDTTSADGQTVSANAISHEQSLTPVEIKIVDGETIIFFYVEDQRIQTTPRFVADTYELLATLPVIRNNSEVTTLQRNGRIVTVPTPYYEHLMSHWRQNQDERGDKSKANQALYADWIKDFAAPLFSEQVYDKVRMLIQPAPRAELEQKAKLLRETAEAIREFEMADVVAFSARDNEF